jgi:hypothetical protein
VYDKATYFRTIGYQPHEKQWLYHNSRARFRLPNCGRRFGKSTMAGRDLEPQLFMPSKMFWIVGPTYDLGEKEFRVIWDDLIVRQQLGRDKRVKKSYNKKQGNMYLEFPWRTRLEVRSADHPENLVGEALDHVIMSEAAKHKEETWERFIRPALADKRGSADFPTTPEGHNWLWAIWMYGQNDEFPDYESWRFPSWDNLKVYPGGLKDPEILLLRKTMTTERFDQEIGADFSSFAGKIFPEWDVTKHVTNVKFRPELPNYIAFDWGYTNPLAAVEFQVTPFDEVRVWRLHYRAYTTLPEHVRMLKQREQPEGYHLDLAFGDAADPEAAIYISTHLVMCIALPEAKENWREGIDLVRTFMKDRETDEVIDEYGTPAEGKPALLVDFSCADLIHELNNYKAPESVKGRNVPEMGNKVQDHAIDALRYGIVHKFKFGAGASLADVYGGQMDGNTDEVGAGFFTNETTGFDNGDEESGFFTNAGVF